MAYTTIPKSTAYFSPEIYTGNGSSKTISTLNFQPDWVWIKNRATTDMNVLFDSLRGATKRIASDSTAAEATEAQDLTAFNTNGFTVGTSGAVNTNSVSYASWNWKANGAGSTNTVGSITSTVSVNTTSGFSMVRWAGSGSLATIGHGLGVVPKMIICKSVDTGGWGIYHEATGNGRGLFLNIDGVGGTDVAYWNNTSPTSSVFTVNFDGGTNREGGNTMMAYCFADVPGFSKIGSYTGNGNADGTFNYTGFKPAWVMIKNTSSGGSNWRIFDNQRLGYNVNNATLYPNLSNAEADETSLDLLSNGFKMRGTTNDLNGNGQTYAYIALASEPLVSTNGNAATAR